LANDFGLELSSTTALTAVEAQAFLPEVHQNFPSATIEEAMRATVKSSRIPSVDGHNVLLLRIGNLPPQAVGAPAGQQLPSVDVFCAMSIYDSNTGAYIATLKAFGDEPNAPPGNRMSLAPN